MFLSNTVPSHGLLAFCSFWSHARPLLAVQHKVDVTFIEVDPASSIIVNVIP